MKTPTIVPFLKVAGAEAMVEAGVEGEEVGETLGEEEGGTLAVAGISEVGVGVILVAGVVAGVTLEVVVEAEVTIPVSKTWKIY